MRADIIIKLRHARPQPSIGSFIHDASILVASHRFMAVYYCTHYTTLLAVRMHSREHRYSHALVYSSMSGNKCARTHQAHSHCKSAPLECMTLSPLPLQERAAGVHEQPSGPGVRPWHLRLLGLLSWQLLSLVLSHQNLISLPRSLVTRLHA